MVGEEWSARSHEIRGLRDRNSVSFSFYPADAEQGKALLQQAGHPAVRAAIAAADSANVKLSRVEQIKRFAILPVFWEPGG